ncbi:rRNA processing/ribosome biogenesis-domain-containing protein [Usnea florida]
MAPQDVFNPLRAVTQRLSSTSAKQLPHVAPYLASTILQSGNAFATTSTKAVTVPESTVTVHKLKTQFSALLQDKGPEARYAGVILVKAAVGAGGWNVLQGVGPWVRGLIGILGKPDNSATKQLCIVTLTNIFLLNHEHQSLVREITIPSLPGFIVACLNLLNNPRSAEATPETHAPSPHLLVILQALSELIVIHPTSFRPFLPQMQSLTHPLIAPTPSSVEIEIDPTSDSISESAQRLFVLFHVCGPKNTAGEEWAKSVAGLIASAHKTIDKVFRSLIEDYTPSIGAFDGASSDLIEDVVSDPKPVPLALPAWIGIDAGVERLDGLLRTLHAFLASRNATAVNVPLGQIHSLVDRVLSAFPPGNGRIPRIRPEIARDEREGLWAGLPRLQTTAIGVSSLMLSRMGFGSASLASTILEQTLWIFESQCSNDGFRGAAYGLVSQVLSSFGLSLPKTHAASLSRCIRLCCEDLLPSVDPQLQAAQASFPETQRPPNGSTSSNADSYLKSVTNQVYLSATSNSVLQAAKGLLPLTLSNLPNDFLPFSLRCQIDRTAIITDNKEAMLARQKQTSSILPLLARAHPEALEVEALLRPQLPPIQFPRSEEIGTESDDADTYMHDPSQFGQSSGFHQNSVDRNENAGVQRDIIMGQSGKKVNTTPGATEEGAPSTEPSNISGLSTRRLSEPQYVFSPVDISPVDISPVDKKRNREEEPGFDTQEDIEDDIQDQAGAGSAQKRSRVDLDEAQEQTPLKLTPADPTFPDTSVPAPVSKTISPFDSAAVSNTQPILENNASDESDFEMPILNMDSDTDEEEAEEKYDD